MRVVSIWRWVSPCAVVELREFVLFALLNLEIQVGPANPNADNSRDHSSLAVFWKSKKDL